MRAGLAEENRRLQGQTEKKKKKKKKKRIEERRVGEEERVKWEIKNTRLRGWWRRSAGSVYTERLRGSGGSKETGEPRRWPNHSGGAGGDPRGCFGFRGQGGGLGSVGEDAEWGWVVRPAARRLLAPF